MSFQSIGEIMAARIAKLKDAGVVVIPSVGAAKHAKKVAGWGADAVIPYEQTDRGSHIAAGHGVIDSRPLYSYLPKGVVHIHTRTGRTAYDRHLAR